MSDPRHDEEIDALRARVADLELRAREHGLLREELERSERRYRNLVEKQHEGLGIVDPDERFTFANPAAHRIFGVATGTLVGRSLEEFTDPESFAKVKAQTALRKERQESVYEMELLRADGERRIILVSASPQLDDAGDLTGTFGVFRDVTEIHSSLAERERLEQQLRHSQKMETAGRLAGGVAHDFNNLLTVVQGSAELMLLRMRHDDPLLSLVKEILEASDMASSLTRQLLAFSTKQVLDLAILDPVDVVRRLERMLRRLIGENIEVAVRTDTEVGQIRADRGQLEQVLINLAVNARDAMPGGGKLSIEVKPERVDVAIDPSLAGDWARISVEDTGVGMSPEVVERIFEPFFTTKEKARGTGLGLSMVYGIVRQIGGQVRVASQPGKGSRFDLYLPQVTETVDDDEPSDAGRRSEPPGMATILVVEDDAGVRRLASLVLKTKGYKVLEAGRGSEAVEVLENASGPIHLVILDVILPGRTGPELARLIGGRWPDLKVLYMSGYPDDALGAHGVLDEGQNFIAKPFSTTELVRKVRSILEG